MQLGYIHRRFVFAPAWTKKCENDTRLTDHSELMILQSKSSQHMRRLAWWSARTDGGTRMGSTSQFSSDSYKARMKSPAGGGGQSGLNHHNTWTMCDNNGISTQSETMRCQKKKHMSTR